MTTKTVATKINLRARALARFALLTAVAAAATPLLARAHAAPQSAAATTAKTWIGETAKVEEALKSSEIERFEDIGTGVTKPRRAYLKAGGLLESFTWKPLPPGRRGGYWESYKAEIAAYVLDKRLALNMVPPVVEREVDGEFGAAVMWIEPTISVKELGGTIPAGRVPGHDIRKMQTFDNFIGNPDRNAGNILIDRANNMILIDHSRAFMDDKKLPTKIERVDADLWSAIQALTAEELQTLLSPLVGEAAVNAMIERRARMKKTIDSLVAKKGRALIIIPSDR